MFFFSVFAPSVSELLKLISLLLRNCACFLTDIIQLSSVGAICLFLFFFLSFFAQIYQPPHISVLFFPLFIILFRALLVLLLLPGESSICFSKKTPPALRTQTERKRRKERKTHTHAHTHKKKKQPGHFRHTPGGVSGATTKNTGPEYLYAGADRGDRPPLSLAVGIKVGFFLF